MSREIQVRLCERLRVQFPWATHRNIYVRSERAGQRVMASVTSFIERRLRLKVNTQKSAVARPEERHFLGFSLRREPTDGNVEVTLSKRSKERIDGKTRELTPRNWGNTLKACIARVNEYLIGWIGFFGICTAEVERTLSSLDAHIRRRLRAIQLKQWKSKRTIAQQLIRRGVKPKHAWNRVYGERKSIRAMSILFPVHRALPNSHWDERGLESFGKAVSTDCSAQSRPGATNVGTGIGEDVNRPTTGLQLVALKSRM